MLKRLIMKKKIKVAESDFLPEMLPKNRKEVFFDCLKMRYPVFLWAGIVLFLFSLPVCLLLLFRDFQIYGLYASFQSGGINENELSVALTSYRVSFTLAQIIALPIFGLGLAGVIKVLRRLIWGEGIFYSADFKDGIKENGLRYVILFALAGVIISLCVFIETYMSDAGNPVRYILFAILIILLLPAMLYMFSLTAIYNIKAWGCIKNSFILYVKTFPVTILFALILAAVYFGLLFIPNLTVKYILAPILIVFALPLFITAWLLYSCRVFDKFINKEHHPEYYNKGIGGI